MFGDRVGQRAMRLRTVSALVGPGDQIVYLQVETGGREHRTQYLRRGLPERLVDVA